MGVVVDRAAGAKGVIPAGCIVWAAGVRATPVAVWLGVAPDRGDRVRAGDRLAVARRTDIDARGDAAVVQRLVTANTRRPRMPARGTGAAFLGAGGQTVAVMPSWLRRACCGVSGRGPASIAPAIVCSSARLAWSAERPLAWPLASTSAISDVSAAS